ncbi:MAG: right-handed parallel beta-helix repeat-containing protein [Nanoarchaeota archaeon]|nr:right-handed parallel beta-helix repeat-containing protein [Nanoarchaeota archaeon]
MKKDVACLIGILIMIFIIENIYSYDINIANPVNNTNFSLYPNSAGMFLDINITSDVDSFCEVVPGACPDNWGGMISFCFYLSPKNISNDFLKKHNKRIFIVNNNLADNFLLFKCANRSNYTIEKTIYFKFNYSTISGSINCGDNISSNMILSKDILECLSKDRNTLKIINDNVVLDCNNHIIDSLDYLSDESINYQQDSGISVINKKNITIKNCVIKDHYKGIYLSSTNNSKITSNIIYNNNMGIYESFSSYNTINNNLLYNNHDSLYFVSSLYDKILHNTIRENSISGMNIWTSGFFNISNNDISDNTFAGIVLNSDSNMDIEKNIILDNQDGLYLYSSVLNNIRNNTIRSNLYGIELFYNSNMNKAYLNDFYKKGVKEILSSNNSFCINNLSNNYYNGAIGPSCESACVPQWLLLEEVCETNDKIHVLYLDLNSCNTTLNRPGDHNTFKDCDFCKPLYQSFYTNWSRCEQGLQKRTKYYVDSNPSCCEATTLASDCNKPSIYNNITDSIPCQEELYFDVNNPDNLILNKNNFYLNLSSNYILYKMEYKDITDRYPKFMALCIKCQYYYRSRGFREGFHNFTINGVYFNKNITHELVFFIDSKKPQISNIKPQTNAFTNGSFYIKYNEENLKNITLFINSEKNFIYDCESGKNKECNIKINMTKYNGQDIIYRYELMDIAKNLAQSRSVIVHVDTTSPVINNPDNLSTIFGNYVTFNIDINEKNFKSAEYMDLTESNPRYRNLCTSLKNNRCIKKTYFKDGYHEIIIRILDKAGNSAYKTMGFEVI